MPRKKNEETGLVVPENGHVPAPTTFIPEQGRVLMEAMDGSIEPHAIQTRPGPGGRELKYVSHGYISSQLNKVFGPFWSFRAVDILPGQKYNVIEYQVESKNPRTLLPEYKTRKEIVVMGELRIRIYSNEGTLLSEEVRSGSGGKVWENNINFTDALQSAESEALKRAAFRLGNKFGLELYYSDEIRRTEYDEKNAPKPIAIPTTLGQFFAWMQKLDISDEEFFGIVGFNIGDTDPVDGKPMPKEKDIPAICEKLLESRGGSNGA